MSELPPELQRALATELDRTPRSTSRSAAALSRRYREDRPATTPILADAAAVTAYLTTRLPATYAAIRAAAAEAADGTDMQPRTLLDLGAGCGSATWALRSVFPTLERSSLVDYSRPALQAAQRLLSASALEVTTTVGPADRAEPGERYDVAVAAYLLGELPEAGRTATVQRMLAAADTVLVVEPGTTGGYHRILQVRASLIDAGWSLLAPCPHAERCPLTDSDWCHFAVRLARSAAHRAAKGAERGFEDEAYSYVAARRGPVGRRPARILRRPRARPGHVLLTLCEPDGTAAVRTVAARDRAGYRTARKADWGGTWPG